MNRQDDTLDMNLPDDFRAPLEAICRAYERAWENNEHPVIETFAKQVSGPAYSEAVAILILLDVKLRLAAGERPQPQTYRDRFPEHEKIIETAFSTVDTPFSDLMSVGEPSASEQTDYPRKLGRYEVVSELGSGGFGVVCLARDVTLERMVALKFGLRSKFLTEAHVSAFIREARTIAQLQHPAIVTIYDVLQVDQWLCIVQQFVDDGDLRQHLKAGQLTFSRTVEISRQLAAGLAFSHSRGFVHCDIKPANILMDKAGNPYIADFGLAIHEVNRVENGARAGTPRYMPPEVVMGETHRIDGRADIWSLGVMMYEMLTGVSPFRGVTQDELFDQIRFTDPRSPRSLAPTLPRELERICLKCLSKSVLERYRLAQELQDDLEHWISQPECEEVGGPDGATTRLLVDEVDSMRSERDPSVGGENHIPVVPRGLQSYSDRDAEFFLRLVPGPRDREGLPESIRFWRNWVRDNDPLNNSVGLLYGPSGSGKSSFVKAGLLPKLTSEVTAVYVEATNNETEERLLRGLRKALPSMPLDLSLQKVLEQVRDGKLLPYGKKLFLVFDQFEQWLNDRSINTQQELVRVLRHCDGERVRALILIRDDFWLPANRLMHELDIELNLGRNAKLIDLFDKSHARKVLYEFGSSYGTLPRDSSQLTKAQRNFVKAAVDGLAEQDRVVSIRLAIFAEMFRDRPWTTAELTRVGGPQGVGFKFLEHAFSSVESNPTHRMLKNEARMLLEALVPVSGQQIRGRMLPVETLREVCGMTNRTVDFQALVKLLDQDLRLITPIGVAVADESTKADGGPTTHYQLTHDFLVGSLREWLTQKKRSTRRGRAELCLEDRAESWTLKPESRQLPSTIEYLNIQVWTKSSRWTLEQAKMMGSATWHYGGRLLLTLMVSTSLGWGTYAFLDARGSEQSVANLMQAETAEVPTLVDKMSLTAGVQSRIEAQLNNRQLLSPRQELHLELARWKFTQDNPATLLKRLPDMQPNEIQVLTKVTEGVATNLIAEARQVLEKDGLSQIQRVAVSAALTQWDPSADRWSQWGPQVSNDIVKLNTYELAPWAMLLKPVAEFMYPTLTQLIRDSSETPENPLVVYTVLLDSAGEGRSHLRSALNNSPPRSDLDEETYIRHSIHQARLAVALIRLGESDESLWSFLRSDENLTRRSFMIEYFSKYQVEPEVLVRQIEKAAEPQIIAALLMCLGSYPKDARIPQRLFTFVERSCLVSRDGFVRSCGEWFLRKSERSVPVGNLIAGANWRPLAIDDVHFNEVLVEPPAGRFKMSRNREVQLSHKFWMSTTEIPIGVFKKFDPDYKLEIRDVGNAYNMSPLTDQNPCGPGNDEAARFCNWLSKQCGIAEVEHCYEIDEQGKYMKLVENWEQKRGFRFPTEAEWEFACQAENPDSWNFGRSVENLVLNAYAWNSSNVRIDGNDYSSRIGGLLKPNRLGIFDMHGNASEYAIFDDPEKDAPVLGQKGGTLYALGAELRVAYAFPLGMNLGRNILGGFRVVRIEP
jgi:serine/threonine protein kinase